MVAGSLAYLFGVVLLYRVAELPSAALSLSLLSLPPLLLLHPRLRRWALPALLFVVGFNWAALDASQRLQPRLPAEAEGAPLEVSGVIDSLPQRDGRILRFVFAAEAASLLDGTAVVVPERLRISWYDEPPQPVRPGQRWHLRVKLKRPWSMRNPGGFDYERWLFAEGIGATGYVRSRGDNRLLDGDIGGYRVARLRQSLQQAIQEKLDGHAMRGMVTALAIGERSAISDEQWQVLMATGTNHLVAISGLHVGLVAGLLFALLRWGWRRCPRCCLLLPAPRAAALGAMGFALVYAALAGFSIPTQRALIMLAVVLGGVWLQRPLQRLRVLLLAVIVVVTLDPVSVLAAGFWLSFAAVAWILYGMGGRVAEQGVWWRWGRVQLLVAIGLLPLLLLFFQQGSLSAPLANILAVPWVSLLVVPLTLLGTLIVPWLPSVGGGLLHLAAMLLDWLWPYLQWLDGLVPVLPLAASGWTLCFAVPGLLWLLAPKGWPLRPAGLLLLLPLFVGQGSAPAPGNAAVTLLDVGQGLSAVVQTHNHVLVFDTGPRYPSGFNTGDAAVIPFLRQSGVRRIDTLMISHGGNDHSGGARALLDVYRAERVLGGLSSQEAGFAVEPCRRGQQWRWDGVAFRVLHPPQGALSAAENDRSCVLAISAGGERLLLTADIEAAAEASLLNSDETLQADLLVAPHHGSKTSSTRAFVDAVGAGTVIFSVGYRNRYRFPHTEVVERYRHSGASLYRTDRGGALSFMLGKGRLEPRLFRVEAQQLWHSRWPHM